MTSNILASLSNKKNNVVEQNNSDESSVGEELQHWFLSIWCPEDVSNHISSTPERSAFSLYQRPAVQVSSSFSGNDAARLVVMDLSLLDDDDDDDYEVDVDHKNGEDGRDDAETSPGNRDAAWPSIERTLSFDDWNVQDENPIPSPRAFRFDEWSSTSLEDGHSNFDSVYTSSSGTTASLVIPRDEVKGSSSNFFEQLARETSSFNPISMYYMGDNYIVQKAYANNNSSSTVALIPQSNSYIFQPIQREGSSSLFSLDTSAAPTISIRTDDPLSISNDQHYHSNGVDILVIPECRGIPRVGSEDDEDLDDRLAIRTIQIDLGDDHDDDNSASRCCSSPTNYVPPIPQVIYVRKEPKGWKKKIIRSWKRVVAMGRHSPATSTFVADKTCFKRRGGSKKKTRGEF